MNDEQLQALQNKIMQETIDAPAEMDLLIQETAEKVARDLALRSDKTARVEFQEEILQFKAHKTVLNYKEVIYLVVVNEEHRKLGGNKYRPFTVTSEIDNSFSYVDNLKAIVETFLRHISGLGAQAEELQ